MNTTNIPTTQKVIQKEHPSKQKWDDKQQPTRNENQTWHIWFKKQLPDHKITT